MAETRRFEDANVAGGPTQPDKDILDIRDLARALGGRVNTSEIEKFGNKLKAYEEAKDKESPELEAETQKQYELMHTQSLRAVADMYDKIVKQKKNAYPYDHRMAEATVDSVIGASLTFREEEWLMSNEGKLWLKRMEKDGEWLSSLLHISVENTASLPYYYDVVQQMQILKERYRAFVTADDLQGMFAKDVEGLEFTIDESRLLKDKKIGLNIPKKYEDEGLVRPGETIGLRELGVKMQDAFFEHRMKIAAVSQVDFVESTPEATTFMGTNLKAEEISFYSQILWRHKGSEGYILAPHVVSGEKLRRDADSILEALLTTNAGERLANIILTRNGSDRADAISELANEVKAEALVRQTNWKKRSDTDIVSNLATLITRQGLLQDYAFMHAYRYCWARVWNTDASGKIIDLKKIELGSIYSPSGDLPSLYWVRRAAVYDGMSNSRTQFLPPTSEAWRNQLDKLPPENVPSFDPNTNTDEFLKDRWGLLVSNDPKYRKERAEFEFEDMDPGFVDFLKRNARLWGTPYTDGYLRKDPVAGGMQLDIPFFFPPGLGIANFFETIGTDPDLRPSQGGKTVWQELIEGKKLSEINWKGLESQAVDRWHVDMDMASRYMRVMIEIYDKEKDPFVNLVAHEPSTLGPKELAKRLRLSFRDDDETGPSKYEIALVPFFIVQVCADKYGISSPRAWKRLDVVDEVDRKTLSRPVDRFVREMSYWIRAFKWLPKRRGDNTTNYGNSMAILATYYMQVLLRVGKASAEEANYLSRAFNEESVNDLNVFDFVGKGFMNEKFRTMSIED